MIIAERGIRCIVRLSMSSSARWCCAVRVVTPSRMLLHMCALTVSGACWCGVVRVVILLSTFILALKAIVVIPGHF